MLLILALTSAGCGNFASSERDGEGAWHALHERRLSDFEHRLALARHVATDDEATRLGEAWLGLVNCSEQPDLQNASWPRASVWLEGLRRDDLLATSVSVESALDATMFEVIYQKGFFDRQPRRTDSQVVWPASDEQWPDEYPVPLEITSRCATIKKRLQGEREEPYFEFDRILRRYVEPETPVAKRARWLAELYRAELAYRGWRDSARALQRADERTGDEAREDAQKASETWRSRMTHSLSALDDPPSEVPVLHRAEASLLQARWAVSQEEWSSCASSARDAHQLGLEDSNRWVARYLDLRCRTALEEWASARELADELPPSRSAWYSPYIYHLLRSIARMGDDDELFSSAMSAFRDRGAVSNAYEAAAYRLVLERLARYDFDDRTVELLEEMGPRGQTYERTAAYARLALDRGETENARAAASYLLSRDPDARNYPSYHGLRALAAFYEADREAFSRHVRTVAARDPEVLKAVPRGRRAGFYAASDSELARILRQMLPAMAEWGDTAGARELRQSWLKVIVDESQRFLRENDETRIRRELIDLYRTASALLEEHPRGYVERVGKLDAAPLVLGTVNLAASPPNAAEPPIEVELSKIWSIAVLPADGDPTTWSVGWPREDP